MNTSKNAMIAICLTASIGAESESLQVVVMP
jgi:hypothetical protein